jgi:hypothetical protein
MGSGFVGLEWGACSGKMDVQYWLNSKGRNVRDMVPFRFSSQVRVIAIASMEFGSNFRVFAMFQ